MLIIVKDIPLLHEQLAGRYVGGVQGVVYHDMQHIDPNKGDVVVGAVAFRGGMVVGALIATGTTSTRSREEETESDGAQVVKRLVLVQDPLPQTPLECILDQPLEFSTKYHDAKPPVRIPLDARRLDTRDEGTSLMEETVVFVVCGEGEQLLHRRVVAWVRMANEASHCVRVS